MSRRQAAGLDVPLQPVTRPRPRQLPLNVLLQVVLLLLRDNPIQYDEENADHQGEDAGGDELVPPAARALRAPRRQVAGQQTAHQQETTEDQENHPDVEHPDRGDDFRV